jgi:hypothetical protein
VKPTILTENHPEISVVFPHTRLSQAVTKWAGGENFCGMKAPSPGEACQENWRAGNWRLGFELRFGTDQAAALSFAPVSLAPARRLTFPDQQQNLQNAAEQRVADRCDGGIKMSSYPDTHFRTFPCLNLSQIAGGVWSSCGRTKKDCGGMSGFCSVPECCCSSLCASFLCDYDGCSAVATA